jgi:hypothetical protein
MEKMIKNQNLTPRIIEDNIIQIVGKELFKLNLVVSYPYSDELIEFMAKTILKLDEQLDVIELSEIIDDVLMGKIKYTKEHGVTIILKNLEQRRNFKNTIENKW